jgi:hypothetical protein
MKQVVWIFIAVILSTTACIKERSGTIPVPTSAYIRNIYNDTFKINVIYGPEPEYQDTSLFQSIFLDINNDSQPDIELYYYRNYWGAETALHIKPMNGFHLAYDSFSYYYELGFCREFIAGDTIEERHFDPADHNYDAMELFNSNPAWLSIFVDLQKLDSTNVFYIGVMDNSFESPAHQFGWLKLKIDIAYFLDGGDLNLNVEESVFYTTPLKSIKAGQY